MWISFLSTRVIPFFSICYHSLYHCSLYNKIYYNIYIYYNICLCLTDKRCDNGWSFYGGNCYFREDRNEARTSWEKAQEICESKQANLITVNDANEQKFLSGVLGKKGSWCGLNNKDNAKVFKWVSGEESEYTYWAPEQPRTSKKARCVHMQLARQHKWVMLKCARKARFTCEKGKFYYYTL